MTEKYYNPLSDMSRIKESLMYLFSETEDITGLIMPTSDNVSFTRAQNWYGGEYVQTEGDAADVTVLPGHCFDTPYIEGIVPDGGCAVFIETYLTKAGNQRIKEVGVDISVVCHKDMIRLSEAETEYYKSVGIYGNRIDSAVQAINSVIMKPETMELIKKEYSVGEMTLAEENPIKQYTPGPEFYGKSLSYTYQTFYQRKNYTK